MSPVKPLSIRDHMRQEAFLHLIVGRWKMSVSVRVCQAKRMVQK